MGRMTEDMTRLVAEINTERCERGRLMREMQQSTADMKRAVADMKAGSHAAHAQMAREQRQNLGGFMSNLHNTVAGMRTAFASDLAGARAAFFGTGAGSAHRGRARRAA